MKKIFAIFLLLSSVFAVSVSAQNESVSALLAKADSAYIDADYMSAIEIYSKVVETEGVSATLYMNLGNAYMKVDEIAKAILCYERAFLIDPSDADVKFNLELARTKIVDKVSIVNELFIVTWMKRLVSVMDIQGWSILTIFLFVLAMAAFIAYILSKKMTIRKISFYFGVVWFVFYIFTFIFATTQKSELENRDHAIIMQPSVTVKSTPSASGTDLFIIHEGRKVKVLDNSMKEWVEIELEDGNKGWVQTEVMEII
ncbi:MAG: tetratricopeptide repeat protein [Bacteroidaceae bacterium]|nr:tetratricopeptide repeat protein [Bacteroidaceae bacterium]